MRKLIAVAVVATAFASLFQNGAEARKQYMDAFKAKYTKVAENKDNKINCNVCHEGTNKKDRNNYGKALAKNTGENQKDSGKIDEALKKTEGEKSAVEGKTFGDLLNDGKLPASK